MLSLSVAGGLGLALAPRASRVASAQSAGRRWGVQLYTVRDQIERDPASTLKAIAEIGFRELEVLQETLSSVGPLASSLGLSPVSLHIDPTFVLDAGSSDASKGLSEVVDRAKAFGVRYLVMAWIPFERRPAGAEGYRQLGVRLNRVGEEAARAGMQLAYHNHAFEFQAVDGDRRAIDVLLSATDPSLVKLELDAFWVSVTGADPVELIRRLSGRIALMHLKDKANGVGPLLREDLVPRTAFAEVGSGSLDFRAILEAADAAGVSHYFVEQDHTPGDPIDSLRKSFAHLRSLRG
jgi:sugar phosphate isomerase/epimerase